MKKQNKKIFKKPTSRTREQLRKVADLKISWKENSDVD